MKKILVTGVNSYVGNQFAEWVEQYPDDYLIDKVSLRGNSWKEIDLSVYDSILHVAGIAHQKETKKNAETYYQINRDLAYDVAKKAKENGVKQFVFLSSMSVYGLDEGVINHDTPLTPKTNYGKSKLEAEQLIEKIADDQFKVTIIRPPMIYGKGCKGNYQRLRKIALKTPIFPNIDNKRSMIYTDNLSEFIRLIIDNFSQGIFYPQNEDYVNTSELVRVISKLHKNRVKMVNIFNPILNIIKSETINKVFGNLIYDKSLSKYKNSYQIYDFKSSIKESENLECVSNGNK